MTHAPDCAHGIERVVVIHDFASSEGGAGVLAIQAAQEYQRRGIPVTFFAGAIEGGDQELNGIDLVGLHAARLLDISPVQAIIQGFHNSTANQSLRDWITKHDTNHTVYHLHNWSQILSPAIFAALEGVEERLVVTCHDFFNICPNGGFTDFPRSQPCELQPLSRRCLVSQCDRRSSFHKYWRVVRQVHLNRLVRPACSKATFTFLHDRMRKKFVDNGFSARRMVTIPNPVQPWSSTRIAAENNREFLFVGRLGRDKGADLAAEACIQAGVPLTLVGRGELDGRLREAGGELRLTGWCNRTEILDHASRARALIVPSRVVEPFGLVIVEAAMSGLPVIVSERAYLSDDCQRLGFGQTFDPAEPGNLTKLVERISNDDAAVARMSSNGVVLAGELASSVPAWTERFIELFRDAIVQQHTNCRQIGPGPQSTGSDTPPVASGGAETDFNI